MCTCVSVCVYILMRTTRSANNNMNIVKFLICRNTWLVLVRNGQIEIHYSQ